MKSGGGRNLRLMKSAARLWNRRLSAEIITMLGVGATLALVTLAIFALLDRRIDRLENNIVRLEGEADGLVHDHQPLAREVSESRGDIRGRLGELPAAV